MEDSAFAGSATGGIDVIASLRLVPKFNKRDSETFFHSL